MTNSRWTTSTAVIGVTIALATSTLIGPARAAVTGATTACTATDIPVHVLPQPTTVHALLCLPDRPTATLQVLVSGGTYNSEYWNYPVDPAIHNYLDAAVKAGFAVLDVDRLGTGSSSHPPSIEVTGTIEAAALHGVVQAARRGLEGHPFTQVALVGHSVGSIDSVLEAATYHDVNGVMLTGFSHHMNYPHLLTVFATSLRPAPFVPGYQPARPLDMGYFTSLPDTRYADFDAPAHIDPAVLAHDEATKDVFSVAEAADGVPLAVAAPLTLSIDAPVAIVTGAEDSFFCGGAGLLNVCATAGGFYASEAAYFSPAAHLTTDVVSGAGHDLNLMDNSAWTFQTILAWCQQYVPASRPR